MIDLKKFRENPQYFIKATKNKQEEVDFDTFIKLDNQLRELQKKLDTLKNQRNILSKQIPTIKDAQEKQNAINQVQNLKKEIENIEKQFNSIKEKHFQIWIQIPNPASEDVPVGIDESDNKILAIYTFDKNDEISIKIKKQWEKAFEKSNTTPNSKPVPHWEILEKRNLIDPKRGAKISGSRFLYIRDGLALLELALVNFTVEKLYKKGFRPTIVPNLVKEEAMLSTGFFPAEEKQIYKVNPGEDNLFLIGTSEVSLVAQHMNEVIDVNELPLRYIGISPCYRREVGKSGKDIRGLIRLHQFEKVEMVSFVKPEDSEKEHQLLLSIEEEIYQDLGLPYRKILICTGDLGAPASKKYDLEGWFPGMQTFKEITSCSNTTDYQARRGNIKFKSKDKKDYLHTLNGTAIALQRTLAFIVENYQTSDGRIIIPYVLRKYFPDNEYLI